MTQQPETGPELAPEHVIAALNEELQRVNNNRLYLLALLTQTRAQYAADVESLSAEIRRLTEELTTSMDPDALPQDERRA